MADDTKTTPAVQYGSEENLSAGRGQGRDGARTADGDVPPEKSGRNAEGARDAFISTEVTDEAARRGRTSTKTTS